MQKFKKMSIGLLVAVLMLTVALAYALFQTQVNHTFVIVASETFKLYENEACTIEVTSIDWGSTVRNVDLRRDFWIKSFAEVDINVWFDVVGVPSGVTLQVMFNGFGLDVKRVLPVGAVYPCKFVLLIDGSAGLGSFNIVQTFYGEKVP